MQLQFKIKTALAFSFTLLTLPLQVKAEASEGSLKTHNLGFGAGFLSGYGLTYRHWYPSGNGYQLAFIPIATVNEHRTFFNSSTGAIGLHSLHQTLHSNFFGYYGGHYNFTFEKNTNARNSNIPVWTEQSNNVLHNIYAGGGMGLEVHVWNVNVSVMAGYAANSQMEKNEGNYFDYNSQKVIPNSDSGKWKNTFELQPSGEVALFYSF